MGRDRQKSTADYGIIKDTTLFLDWLGSGKEKSTEAI
jgi:hypothetical protein